MNTVADEDITKKNAENRVIEKVFFLLFLLFTLSNLFIKKKMFPFYPPSMNIYLIIFFNTTKTYTVLVKNIFVCLLFMLKFRRKKRLNNNNNNKNTSI